MQEKSPSSRTIDTVWKWAYIILCFSLIALTAYQIYFVLQMPGTGWDYRVYAGAVQSVNHLQNPYVLENINQYTGGENLPFTYPPHTLYFFWLLDFFFVFRSIGIYYGLLLLLLTVSGYLLVSLDKKPQYLFLATLLLTGFMGIFWNFLTGNKDILFLFLFTLIFGMLVKEKYWQSSVLIGITAAFSLITAPFIALFLVIRSSFSQRIAYMLLSSGIFALLFLVSYCIYPAFFISYIGTILGTSSPLYDPAGVNTPTPFLMFGDLLGRVYPGNMGSVVLASGIYSGIILFSAGIFYSNHKEDRFKMYALVMLAIFMLLPRTKPYDFVILVIPLYFLLRDYSYRLKILVLAGISLLPLFVWYYRYFWETPYDLPFMLRSYSQTYSLIFIFMVIILNDLLTPAVISTEKKEDP